MRAVCLEFPDDPTAWYLDRQFMVGQELMAAPVFEESGEVEFYLPKGKWTSFFTNEMKAGPGWFKERHGFGTLPLYVRENTVLVLGSEKAKGAVYDYTLDAEVCLYQVTEGDNATLVGSDGNEIGTVEVGSDGKVKATQILKGSWTVSEAGRNVEGAVPRLSISRRSALMAVRGRHIGNSTPKPRIRLTGRHACTQKRNKMYLPPESPLCTPP